MEDKLKEYLQRIAVYNENRFDAITNLLDDIGISYMIQERSHSIDIPIYGEPDDSIPSEQDCIGQMDLFRDFGFSSKHEDDTEDDEENTQKEDGAYGVGRFEDYAEEDEPEDPFSMLEGMSVEDIEDIDESFFDEDESDVHDDSGNKYSEYDEAGFRQLSLFNMLMSQYRRRIIVGYRQEIESIRNIIIPLTRYYNGPVEKRIVFMAHYDAVPGSTGANDNGSSIAILIAMCEQIVNSGKINIPVEVVFTDREETGGLGCRMYLEQYSDSIIEVINLDTCGVGSDVVVSDWLNHMNQETNVLSEGWYNEGTGYVVFSPRLPYCDSDIVHSRGIGVMTICTLPDEDVCEILMNKPTYRETYKYMHNGAKDSIEYINYKTMANILNYISQIFI